MLFNSYVFLFYFLPITIIGYYSLARYIDATAAKIWLVLASFVFYGWWYPPFVILLLVSITANYALSLCIIATAERPLQGWILTAGIGLNLSALIYYKYVFSVLQFFQSAGFITSGIEPIVLPIGISFFTFTQIGYLVDCREGLVRERGILDYVLFVTFFPHLIAGPILHHREIMPQFADAATYRLNERNIAVGATLFVVGLAKKAVLADTIAPWVEAGFAHPGSLGALTAWSTLVGYAMQLYFDFSGYSDMALGLGGMFGVRLPLNFNSPLKSTSIIDYWQRWHMTLTRYLTLLLYNPISLWVTRRRMARGLPVNRRAVEKPEGFAVIVAFPTFVTMFLAGVWHGAGIQFIVYGLLHALYLTVNHAARIFGPRPSKAVHHPVWSAPGRIWRVALTFLAVLLAMDFFRADSVSDALALLGSALGWHGNDLPLVVRGERIAELGAVGNFLLQYGIIAAGRPDLFVTVTRPLVYNWALILGLCAVVWGTPNIYQILGDWSPALQKVQPVKWRRLAWQPNLAWAAMAGVMLFYAVARLDHPGRFLYFQF